MRVRMVLGGFVAISTIVGLGFTGCGAQQPVPADTAKPAQAVCGPNQVEVNGACQDKSTAEPISPDAGSAADGASSATGATPDAATSTATPAAQTSVKPVAIADVDLMCALLIGCADVPVPVPTRDHGACVREIMSTLASPGALKFSLTVRECGLRAASCQQFRECALRGADSKRCEGRGINTPAPVGFCDLDGRAVRCWHGKVHSVRDCPRGNESCSIRGGDATCIIGSCAEDGGTSTATCSADGQRILQCIGGKLDSMNCSAFGLGCELMPDGKPECVAATSPRCTGSARRCEGTTYVECVQGHEVRVECGAQGMACGAGAPKGPLVIGSCVAPEPQKNKCDPATYDTRCVGPGSVQFCALGTVQKTFCKALGLNRCVADGNAAHCE